MLGKRIETVEQVLKMAQEGRAIKCVHWFRPCPAAFFQNFQARILHDFIKTGKLYEFTKERNPCRKK